MRGKIATNLLLFLGLLFVLYILQPFVIVPNLRVSVKTDTRKSRNDVKAHKIIDEKRKKHTRKPMKPPPTTETPEEKPTEAPKIPSPPPEEVQEAAKTETTPEFKYMNTTTESVIEKRRRLRQDAMQRMKRAPVKSFHYHALAKTGSFATRGVLRKFCKKYQITCLSACECGHCKNYGSCVERLTKRTGTELNVTFGYMTMFRLTHGCCEDLEHLKTSTAILEHFPLNSPGNKEFIENNLPKDMFKFTLVREPVQQFISYHRQLSNGSLRRHIDIPPLEETIDLFHDWAIKGKREEGSKLAALHDISTNSQIKDLGWDTKDENIQPVIEYLRTFDFVGLSDKFEESWTMLRKALHWPRYYFRYREKTTKSSKRLKTLSDEHIEKIKTIQYADLMLYDAAVQIFDEEVEGEKVK